MSEWNKTVIIITIASIKYKVCTLKENNKL